MIDTEAYEEAEADRERQSAAMADADVAEIVNALLDKGIVEDAGRVLDILSDYRGMANDQLAEALGSQAFADGTEAACLHLEASRRLPAFFKERFRAWDPAAVRQLLDGDLPLADAVCAAAVEVDHENAVAEHRDRTDKAAGCKYSIQVYFDTGPGTWRTSRCVVIDFTAEQAAKIDERREGLPFLGCRIDEREAEAPIKGTAWETVTTCDDPEETAGPADFAMEREFERQRRDPDDRYYDEEEVYRDDH